MINKLPIKSTYAQTEQGVSYTCPMHPQIIQKIPGNCPLCGMSLEPRSAAPEIDHSEYYIMARRFWLGLILTIPILLLAMSSNSDQFSPIISRTIQWILSTPVVFWAGWPFFERAYHSVISRHLNMFSLISLGIGIAYIFSVISLFFPEIFPPAFQHQKEIPIYFETASMITVLVLLGQVLELKARNQTNTSLQALLSHAAKSARVVKDGEEIEIAIDQVKVGDILRIRPGDKIPVDGSIIEGTGLVNESMITGEPIPIEKKTKDAITGGTINQTGSFLMQAARVGNETLLSQIIQMVAKAQRSRAPIQSLADKVSAYFVPIVILVAILTFIIWTWMGPEPSLTYGLVNAVAVLIIACPCALGLATPISIMVGMGRGAEEGILIKNAEALEKLEKVDTIIIDKTGTLTEGKPKLTDIIPTDKWSVNDLLRLTAAVENNSGHPLSEAIVYAAKENSQNILKVINFKSITGGGVSGQVEGHDLLIGKQKLLLDDHIKGLESFQQQDEQLQKQGKTVIYIAIDGLPAGIIAIKDPIKKTTPNAVSELHHLKKSIVMLSGDNSSSAEAVAKELGIDKVHANVEPRDKHDFVKKVQEKGHIIIMAGDGVNDAPALAAANVGIAMGTGTDVAMESADVTLVKGDLMGIVKALHLSRAMMQNIRQNLFFAFIYNILGIPIAAGLLYPFFGLLLNPMIAALAMSLSSVSVIANALRLKNIKL
jgi:Cu+-exporting ATPase